MRLGLLVHSKANSRISYRFLNRRKIDLLDYALLVFVLFVEMVIVKYFILDERVYRYRVFNCFENFNLSD